MSPLQNEENLLNTQRSKKKSLLEKYSSPTPTKWRKIGDSILVGTSAMSAIMMGSPVPEHYTIWIIFGLNIFGVVGKIITNFFSVD
jgi:hypothetical protein